MSSHKKRNDRRMTPDGHAFAALLDAVMTLESSSEVVRLLEQHKDRPYYRDLVAKARTLLALRHKGTHAQ